MKSPSLALLAIPLTVVVFWAARAYGCPTAEEASAHVAAAVSLPIAAGCVTPFAGRLYGDEALVQTAKDIAGLEAMVLDTERRLKGALGTLEDCRREGADELDACAEPLPVVEPLPSRAWIWAGAGSLAVGAPLAGCEILDCGPAHVPWTVAAANAAAIVFVAWLVE